MNKYDKNEIKRKKSVEYLGKLSIVELGKDTILKCYKTSKETILSKDTNTWQLLVVHILFAYPLISLVPHLG